MNFIETNIKIGVEAPFSLLHISDTHFVLADERENERKIKLSKEREKVFIPYPEDKLTEALKYAKENDLRLIHTGDFIDFVSQANLERAKKFIDENDVLFVAGNHEFSLYVGEAFEDEAYRNQSLEYVQKFFKEDIRFNSRQIGGVNFIGIDNGYYRFDAQQLTELKEQVALGLPIILYMHNPLFEKSLFEEEMERNKRFNVANLVAEPYEYLILNSKTRQPVLKPDEATVQMFEFIKNQPLIKAIITGHLHYDFECMITDDLPQYVTGIDSMRRINIV